MATALAEWATDAGIEAFSNLGMLQRVLLWDIGSEAAKTGAPVADNLSSSGSFPAAQTLDALMDVVPNNPLLPAPAAPVATDTNAPAAPKVNDIAAQLIGSIHNLSKGLAKAIAGPARRRDEKAICKAAENAANVIIGFLVWEPKQSSDLERTTYYTNAIGQIRSLLFDGNVTHYSKLTYYRT
jgi:hypothetical protein